MILNGPAGLQGGHEAHIRDDRVKMDVCVCKSCTKLRQRHGLASRIIFIHDQPARGTAAMVPEGQNIMVGITVFPAELYEGRQCPGIGHIGLFLFIDQGKPVLIIRVSLDHSRIDFDPQTVTLPFGGTACLDKDIDRRGGFRCHDLPQIVRSAAILLQVAAGQI